MRLKTENEYRAALANIETCMAADADTPEGVRLDELVALVEEYERENFPLDAPTELANTA